MGDTIQSGIENLNQSFQNRGQNLMLELAKTKTNKELIELIEEKEAEKRKEKEITLKKLKERLEKHPEYADAYNIYYEYPCIDVISQKEAKLYMDSLIENQASGHFKFYRKEQKTYTFKDNRTYSPIEFADENVVIVHNGKIYRIENEYYIYEVGFHPLDSYDWNFESLDSYTRTKYQFGLRFNMLL